MSTPCITILQSVNPQAFSRHMLELHKVTDPRWHDDPASGCMQLFDYWGDMARGGPLPDWSQFSCMDLYQNASNLIVIDVDPISGVEDARYRFVGTGIVDLRHHRGLKDPTGQPLKDADRAYCRTTMDEACNSCVFDGEPIYLRGPYVKQKMNGSHERLILPWVIDGEVRRLTAMVDKHPVRRP